MNPPAFETTAEFLFEFSFNTQGLLDLVDALDDGGAGYLVAKQLPLAQWQYRYDALTPADLAAHTQAKLAALEAMAPEAAYDLSEWMTKADKPLKLPPIWSNKEPDLRHAMAAYLIAATTERLELGQKLGGRTAIRTRALDRTPAELISTGYWICPHCGAEQPVPHTLGTAQPEVPADIRCPQCTHQRDFPTCGCPLCLAMQAEFTAEAIPVVEQALDNLRRGLQQFCADPLAHCHHSPARVPYPGDIEADRDYLQYRDRMSHSLREVLSYRPQSAEDFERCLARCLEKWREHGKFNRGRPAPVPRHDKLIDEARRLRVLYVSDDATSLTEGHLAEQPDLMAVRKLCDAVLADPEHAIGYLNIPRWRRTTRTINPSYQVLIPSCHHVLGVIRRTWLNPFYVTRGQTATPTVRAPATSALPLYRTEAEQATHDRLVQENPSHLVVPHRLLRQIVSKEVLEEHFNSTERNYLFNCELSFAVYDSKGRFCFAVEARSGGHHDTAEWQLKDGLKRRAMELAGLELRESF